MEKFIAGMVNGLTDEEVLEISKELNVDYSHTIESEERQMLADDILEMLCMLEDAGCVMDYLDAPYTNGVETTYKTAFEKAMNIIGDFMDFVQEVQDFKGECANEYKTRYDYIYDYQTFEKDYFSAWLDGCSPYPDTYDIIDQCRRIQKMIEMWQRAVDNGLIDPEAGWAEEEPDMYWAYDAMDVKWILWSHIEDDEVQIAEVGQDEDGTFYWIEIESTCGYCDFATAEEAMADADKHFNK